MVGPELGPESADRVGVPCPALPYQYLARVSSLHYAELVMAWSFLSQHPGWVGFCPFYLSGQFLLARKSSHYQSRADDKTKAKSMGSAKDGCTRLSVFKEQNEAVHDDILLRCLRPCL